MVERGTARRGEELEVLRQARRNDVGSCGRRRGRAMLNASRIELCDMMEGLYYAGDKVSNRYAMIEEGHEAGEV